MFLASILSFYGVLFSRIVKRLEVVSLLGDHVICSNSAILRAALWALKVMERVGLE